MKKFLVVVIFLLKAIMRKKLRRLYNLFHPTLKNNHVQYMKYGNYRASRKPETTAKRLRYRNNHSNLLGRYSLEALRKLANS